MRSHRTYTYGSSYAPTRRTPTLEELFITPEAAGLAKDLVSEMRASQKTLYECMRRLVLAGVTGFKMDVVKDMVGKFPRFGSFTSKQADFALSIVR